MNVETILVGAVVTVVTSVITAYITTRLKMRAEKEKWQREFTIKYAEAQATDPIRAQSIATQFAVGVLTIERKESSQREKIFVPPTCRLVAGRGEENEIDTKDRLTSRRHAAFLADQSNVYVEDLDSKNATLLNGRRVEGRYKLKTGDVIIMGETKIVFHKI